MHVHLRVIHATLAVGMAAGVKGPAALGRLALDSRRQADYSYSSIE
ncbi:MAG: hypothetical protein GY906_31280 [bacterium]|nr:hypothetical protein [bacterium]